MPRPLSFISLLLLHFHIGSISFDYTVSQKTSKIIFLTT